MNPFGIFDAVVGALDIVGNAFGRKRRQESTRERISFWVMYAVLMLLGVAVITFVVWQLYFQS